MLLGSPFTDAVGAAALLAHGATVLDTRPLASYLAGHLPGAVRVDWRIGTVGGYTSGTLGAPDAVAAAFAELGVDDEKPVLVVGAWTEGWGEEGRIAWDLAWLGHRDTWILAGGMDAWSGPTDHWPASARAGHFTASVRPELRVTTAQVSRMDARRLDVREPDEFAGARKYLEARGGHLPAAVNTPWRSLLEAAPDLPADAPILVYCTGGVRSGMAWAVLTGQGFTHVSNYEAGWWEWSRTSSSP